MNLIVDFPETRASSHHNKRRVAFQDEVDMQFIKNLAFSKHREDIWFSKEEMSLAALTTETAVIILLTETAGKIFMYSPADGLRGNLE